MKIKTKAVNNTLPFAINISLYYQILHLHQQISHVPPPRSAAVRPNHTVSNRAISRALCSPFHRHPKIFIELNPPFRVTYWPRFQKTLF
jgi:hypothetical protein